MSSAPPPASRRYHKWGRVDYDPTGPEHTWFCTRPGCGVVRGLRLVDRYRGIEDERLVIAEVYWCQWSGEKSTERLPCRPRVEKEV